jgi:hypothetical protein
MAKKKRWDYMPHGDRPFLTWMRHFLKVLADMLERVGFPVDVFEQLMAQTDKYEEYLEANEDPSRHTQVIRQKKDAAKAALMSNARVKIKVHLAFNEDVTNEDKDRLGLTIYTGKRSAAGKANTAPVLRFKSFNEAELRIYFHGIGPNGEVIARPEDQKGVEFAMAIGPEAPAEWEDLPIVGTGYSSPYTKGFHRSQRGQMVHIAARWVSNLGEPGPWSKIYTVMIP